MQREKLLRDYPLNATLWWLNWFDGRSESALVQWRGLCQGRDVNALMTAGQLINWGMPPGGRYAERTGLSAHATALPASQFATKAERGELVAKAIDAFPQFVRFPNTLEEVAALEVSKSAGLPGIYWPASTTTSAAAKPLPYGSVA